ncbi:hypothetical protein DFJ73DRAFT_599204, partial [Zopfochytrium polystomum]
SFVSNLPMRPFSSSSSFGYFEVTLTALQENCIVSIGLALESLPSTSLPGFAASSMAFVSDGTRSHCRRKTVVCSPYLPDGFAPGDVIGCGYFPPTGDVFFVKNGVFLSQGFSLSSSRSKHLMHAAVGSDGGCILSCNFGTHPFLYSIANEARGPVSGQQPQP